MIDSKLRDLPSVSSLLERPKLRESINAQGHAAVVSAVRRTLAEARQTIRAGSSLDTSAPALEAIVLQHLNDRRRSPIAVINATGILLHTGLGRAPLAAEAIAAVTEVAKGYCDLEFDLNTGKRGARASTISQLLQRLTGAEAATVVNNNAAATILALRVVAKGREVIVSRGELVEIGGSFRLPEIFEVSGAKLREVGTTNKTRLADYQRAITAESAALMRVHASNYRIVGFTESVSIVDLATLGRERGLITIDDLGSGALDDARPPLNSNEPTVAASIRAGADLVLFSGDKLLGGPQCGILCGRSDLVEQIQADPLFRAVRVDKMTLAALGATLRLILDDPDPNRKIPLWNFLTTSMATLRNRAQNLAKRLRETGSLTAQAVDSTSFLGGGSVPGESLPSVAIRLESPWPIGVSSEEELARSLRLGSPPVVARVRDGSVWIDLRAVDPQDDERLGEAVLQAVAACGGLRLS
jgi:L-seryl-tRNA(Ser) seleniumtransferase